MYDFYAWCADLRCCWYGTSRRVFDTYFVRHALRVQVGKNRKAAEILGPVFGTVSGVLVVGTNRMGLHRSYAK